MSISTRRYNPRPTGTRETALGLIESRHEKPTDPDKKLRFHIRPHTQKVAELALELSNIVRPNDHLFANINWCAALFHDAHHHDTICELPNNSPLLEHKRTPDADGSAETASAHEASEHLQKIGMGEDFCKTVGDAIEYGTQYLFLDGILRHPNIEKAHDPVAAYLIGKADVLEPLSEPNTTATLDTTLRFLLERYPDLAEWIVDKGEIIPTNTFEQLREETLPAFVDEEHRFMTSQMHRLMQDAIMLGIDPSVRSRLFSRFDINRFLDTHTMNSWRWANDRYEMTLRLNRAANPKS